MSSAAAAATQAQTLPLIDYAFALDIDDHSGRSYPIAFNHGVASIDDHERLQAAALFFAHVSGIKLDAAQLAVKIPDPIVIDEWTRRAAAETPVASAAAADSKSDSKSDSLPLATGLGDVKSTATASAASAPDFAYWSKQTFAYRRANPGSEAIPAQSIRGKLLALARAAPKPPIANFPETDPLNCAVNNLGWCFHYGFGVVQDRAYALKLFERAAAGGLSVAMNNIGVCAILQARIKHAAYVHSMTPITIPPPAAAATTSPTSAAAAGSPSSALLITSPKSSGFVLPVVHPPPVSYHRSPFVSTEEVESGLKWLNRSMDGGSLMGRVNLGTFYLQGEFCNEHKQVERSTALYEAAAAVGFSPALHKLAARTKDAVGRDYAHARKCYEAAGMDYPPAMYNLGVLMRQGRIGGYAPRDAIYLYERAASFGYNSAIFALAKLHIVGLEKPQNTPLGMSMYHRLSATGDREANLRLSGEMKELKYAELSAALGHQHSISRMAYTLSDGAMGDAMYAMPNHRRLQNGVRSKAKDLPTYPAAVQWTIRGAIFRPPNADAQLELARVYARAAIDQAGTAARKLNDSVSPRQSAIEVRNSILSARAAGDSGDDAGADGDSDADSDRAFGSSPPLRSRSKQRSTALWSLACEWYERAFASAQLYDPSDVAEQKPRATNFLAHLRSRDVELGLQPIFRNEMWTKSFVTLALSLSRTLRVVTITQSTKSATDQFFAILCANPQIEEVRLIETYAQWDELIPILANHLPRLEAFTLYVTESDSSAELLEKHAKPFVDALFLGRATISEAATTGTPTATASAARDAGASASADAKHVSATAASTPVTSAGSGGTAGVINLNRVRRLHTVRIANLSSYDSILSTVGGALARALHHPESAILNLQYRMTAPLPLPPLVSVCLPRARAACAACAVEWHNADVDDASSVLFTHPTLERFDFSTSVDHCQQLRSVFRLPKPAATPNEKPVPEPAPAAAAAAAASALAAASVLNSRKIITVKKKEKPRSAAASTASAAAASAPDAASFEGGGSGSDTAVASIRMIDLESCAVDVPLMQALTTLFVTSNRFSGLTTLNLSHNISNMNEWMSIFADLPPQLTALDISSDVLSAAPGSLTPSSAAAFGGVCAKCTQLRKLTCIGIPKVGVKIELFFGAFARLPNLESLLVAPHRLLASTANDLLFARRDTLQAFGLILAPGQRAQFADVLNQLTESMAACKRLRYLHLYAPDVRSGRGPTTLSLVRSFMVKNPLLACVWAVDTSVGVPPGLEPITTQNAHRQRMEHRAWCRIALGVAFVRANRDSDFRNSILPLVPDLLALIGTPVGSANSMAHVPAPLLYDPVFDRNAIRPESEPSDDEDSDSNDDLGGGDDG